MVLQIRLRTREVLNSLFNKIAKGEQIEFYERAIDGTFHENIAKTIGENVEVKCFDNATDALLEAELSTPDLILTDYKMPDIDGVAFIKILRNNINFRDIPIVIITALDESGKVQGWLCAHGSFLLGKYEAALTAVVDACYALR